MLLLSRAVVRCWFTVCSGANEVYRSLWGTVLLSIQSWQEAGSLLRVQTLCDPNLLCLGEEAAEEADSEDHVVLPGVSGYC